MTGQLALGAMARTYEVTEQLALGAMARSYEVMRRQSLEYDYEKVFWNSAWTVGLIGLGWVAIKLGQFIQSMQQAALGVSDPEVAGYYFMWDYVEGPKKGETPPPGPHVALINYYRNNPGEWEKYKQTMIGKHPDRIGADGKPLKEPVISVLESVDSVYGKYGPIMPVGAVGGHVLVEWLRVKKLKKEMGET